MRDDEHDFLVFHEGQGIANDGGYLVDNPYEPGSRNARLWKKGFEIARRQYRNALEEMRRGFESGGAGE